MKKLYAILLLLLPHLSYAQQIPALLSIEGIGGNGNDNISPRVVATQDGGFILSIASSSTTGSINTTCVNDPGQGETLFRKYNFDGTQVVWEKCYESTLDSYYNFMFPTLNGEFIVAGGDNNPGHRDFLVRREDANGNILWGSKKYGGAADEFLKDMVATADGGYIMLGNSNSNDGDVGTHYGSQFDEDIWAIKIDSNGNIIWSTVVGGSNIDYAVAAASGPNGGCYIMGVTNSYDYDCTGYHGSGDMYIARLDDSGHVLWHRCLGGSSSDANSGWAISDGKGGLLATTGSYSNDGDVGNHIGGGRHMAGRRGQQ